MSQVCYCPIKSYDVMFPVTNALIDRLPAWLRELASIHPDPVQVPASDHDFRWEYPAPSVEVVQTAKAVRMVSGIRAALLLAELGHTTESGTILRTVSDFASEIVFLAEGQLAGEFVKNQEEFVAQYFVPMPATPDELAARERAYYVGRKAILAAQRRLADRFGGRGEGLSKISRYLDKGYDSYVHGAYETAMELYAGPTRGFMVRGNESARSRCVSKGSVAGKVYEVLAALELMAITRGMGDLRERIAAGRDELDASASKKNHCVCVAEPRSENAQQTITADDLCSPRRRP